jgi:hypothetical protein
VILVQNFSEVHETLPEAAFRTPFSVREKGLEFVM